MERLNRVNRQEGYALCADTLAVLANQYTYIEAILDGMNYSRGTIVALRIDKASDGSLAGGVVYAVANPVNQVPGATVQGGTTTGGTTSIMNKGKIWVLHPHSGVQVDDLFTNTYRMDWITKSWNTSVPAGLNPAIGAEAYITDECAINTSDMHINLNDGVYRFVKLNSETSYVDLFTPGTEELYGCTIEWLGSSNFVRLYRDKMVVQLRFKIVGANPLSYNIVTPFAQQSPITGVLGVQQTAGSPYTFFREGIVNGTQLNLNTVAEISSDKLKVIFYGGSGTVDREFLVSGTIYL